MKQRKRWHIYPTAMDFETRVVRGILRAAREAIATRDLFRIVLAGGKTPESIYRRLAEADMDWRGWHIYWGDEGCVAPEDPLRNSRVAFHAWLDQVSIPREQVHPIPGELGPEAAAEHYTALLAGLGDFDLVLLGLGEDGHTASLFPGREWGAAPESPDVLIVRDAPKPPPCRLSLSANRLSRSREVVFLATGVSKYGAVQRWRCGELLPAAAITPECGVDVCLTQDAFDLA